MRFVRKVLLNIGESIIHPVALAREVDANDVIYAAVVDHGRDRAPTDAEKLAVRVHPVRVQAAVADDISCPLTLDPGGVQKGLCDRAAVDMHLLAMLAVHLHVDHDRWKGSRDRGRGPQDLTKQVERARMLAGHDSAHVL